MLFDQDAGFMRMAIEASRDAVIAGDMPFGAVLVHSGAVWHVSRNNQRTQRELTGHAEVALLREASARLGLSSLRGTTVYASGEPCPMCSGAIFWAGVARVVYAATAADIIDALGGPALPARTADCLAQARPAVAVDGPLLRDEAIAVLRWFATREAQSLTKD